MLIADYDSIYHLCPMRLCGNRDDNGCEGTECMAWRWYDKPDCDCKRRGYCGLAGKPQWDED